ncbi:MAG TPA: glycoside hydrolase family 38 C-terminal domain-containing protein [Capsulimonadaceae bacterium]|nr:glycoside hydrolase family 38 C-terminal domain-containing protein [Capsulimonadaceae bacterium]
MKTIHIIFNAHLDPVWLWPWPAGLDEALATCRSACDRLDANPDIVFTRGEAWVYDQVERIDPELFERIREHVQAGRWEIVGGWWIQPDCNQPTGLGIERQISLGKQYFLEKFGFFPNIAYNVDSFGHAASLPRLMRAAGQRYYVMMRPQEHEKHLPISIFRWQGEEDGPELVAFRIAAGYNLRDEITREYLEKSLDGLPEGIDHTMCFIGVGDHGGGPTEQQIAWCRENSDSLPGCRLVFSSPSRFFTAIKEQSPQLPLVQGDLQYHAIGCYSVHRGIKTAVRRAEHALDQMEVVSEGDQNAQNQLDKAWKRVCFAQFHDTLGGTCLPSAYPAILDQVGYASSIADEALETGLRIRMRSLKDNPLQRVVVYNPSHRPYEGYVEFEPWLEWQAWQPQWGLRDDQGRAVPFQLLHSEALTGNMTRLLFPASLAPMGMRVLYIDREKMPQPERAGVVENDTSLVADSGAQWSSTGLRFPNGFQVDNPGFELIEDQSDTWSHGIDRYSESSLSAAKWETKGTSVGLLMGSSLQIASLGGSLLRAEWRVYAGTPWVHLRLQVDWRESHSVLKLVLPLPERSMDRTDGVLGSWLARPNDGKESPIRDWTIAHAGRARVGVVCPDVYALDATPERIRFTLLRSPLLAHHDPYPADPRHGQFSDRGTHEFRFSFYAGDHLSLAEVENLSSSIVKPLRIADLTRGMPPSVLGR